MNSEGRLLSTEFRGTSRSVRKGVLKCRFEDPTKQGQCILRKVAIVGKKRGAIVKVSTFALVALDLVRSNNNDVIAGGIMLNRFAFPRHEGSLRFEKWYVDQVMKCQLPGYNGGFLTPRT
jgi:hypothetical protein